LRITLFVGHNAARWPPHVRGCGYTAVSGGRSLRSSTTESLVEPACRWGVATTTKACSPGDIPPGPAAERAAGMKMGSGVGWETCADAARDRDAMSGGAKSWLVRVPCTPLSTATPDAIKPCPRFPSHATSDSVLPPGVGVNVRERGCTTSQRLVGDREGP